MALLTYQAFCARMIQKYEGGYGWSRADAGGPTKYGITCFDLAEHRGQKMDSMTRWAPIVQEMTLAEAEEIYATKYAAYVRYNDLPAGPDACTFDYAVNSGIGRGALICRAIVGTPGGSTRLDDRTIDAVHKMDPHKFVASMCDERLRFMHAIKGGTQWAVFGGGWGARVADLRTYCNHLADGAPHETAPAAPDLTKVVQPKATNTPATAGKPTVGGAIAAGGTAAASGVPHWVTGSIVAGVFIAGIAYEAYQDYKATQANNTVHLPLAA